MHEFKGGRRQTGVLGLAEVAVRTGAGGAQTEQPNAKDSKFGTQSQLALQYPFAHGQESGTGAEHL